MLDNTFVLFNWFLKSWSYLEHNVQEVIFTCFIRNIVHTVTQQHSIYSEINNQEAKIKHSHYTCNYFVINIPRTIYPPLKSKTLRDTADRINSNAINYYSRTWQCYGQRVIHRRFVTMVDTLTMQQILGRN